MRSKLRLAHILAVLCVVPMLVGCSAGGSGGGSVPAGSRSAASQAAAALFVQQWAQILWGLVTSQTGTGTPSAGPIDCQPDYCQQTFTAADGTVTVLTAYMDGSAQADITYPSGITQTVLQSELDPAALPLLKNDWQITSSDGLTVTYTSTVDTHGNVTICDDTTELEGTAVLPGGVTQTFHVLTDNGQTTVEAQQSDGSVFTLVVPLILAGANCQMPDFSKPATGTYNGQEFTIDFTLTSTPAATDRWASMASDLGGGLTGQFSLNPDFSGSGQMTQAGAQAPYVSWTATGDTRVEYLSGESSANSPAGAAVDYLTHRWQTLTALLGPSPGP